MHRRATKPKRGSCPYFREPRETAPLLLCSDPSPACRLLWPDLLSSGWNALASSGLPRRFAADTSKRPESAPPERPGIKRSEQQVAATRGETVLRAMRSVGRSIGL